ncbi:MAG TPA: gliding motility-associated C-terminal domain-containing protein [Cytophagaceae bacterium]
MEKVFRNLILKKVVLGVVLVFSFTTTFSAIYVVNDPGDTDDLGPYGATNTLRKCIRLANEDVLFDEIHFNLPGPGPYLITATAALPVITNPVLINGLTQPGASAGNLLIEIDGAGDWVLQLGTDGGFTSSGSTIQGLVIYGANRGIFINGSNNNTLIANYIGTNRAADAVAANTIVWHGIQIINGQNNIIGGTGGANDRNIISGCNEDGIRVSNNSTGTIIIGNYIGTDITGSAAIPNRLRGINCENGSDNTTIGGNTANHRNIISGNLQRGINLALSNNVLIQNNYIGTTSAGTAALANGEQGIFVENNSNDLQLLNNIISGNGQQGVFILASVNPVIRENFFGTDVSGNTAISNGQTNIQIENNSHNLQLIDNLICSSTNGQGLFLINSNYPVIKGNRIGLALDGETALGNRQHGLNIINALKPIIGGTMVAERNYISNNGEVGLRLQNADSVVIKGNYIGLNEAGDTDHGNNNQGIWMEGSDHAVIGGGETGARNYIAGNNNTGMFMILCVNASIIGNYFGTDVSGNTAIPNIQTNIQIENNSHYPQLVNNIICSSQNGQGIFIINSNYPVIKGNRVGLALDGVTALGNRQHGMNIINALKPVIGGTTPAERNYVSNNGETGIRVENGDSVIIKGNYIGLNEPGNADHGNNQNGIWMNLSDYPIIGGGEPGARNYIAGNNETGIHIEQGLQPTVTDNYVGTDVTGNVAIGNNGVGVRIITNSHNAIITHNVISASGQHGLALNNLQQPVIKSNKIGLGADAITVMGNNNRGIEMIRCPEAQVGGTTPEERNYISANKEVGLMLVESPRSKIEGNYVGTDISGVAAKGNGIHGIQVSNSEEVTVGGTVYGARNIVVDSKVGHGILFDGLSPNAIIKGNFVGVGTDGGTIDTNPRLGNGVHGIYVGGDSHGAIIGGSNAIERNVCSNNGMYLPPGPGAYRQGDGIRVEGPDNHLIIGNFCGVDSSGTKERGNAWAGISLNNCDNTTVGGRGAEEFNLCSGNYNEGMYLAFSSNNRIIGNRVGTDWSGILPIGNNDYGINLGSNGANFDNIIGGTEEDANIIAFTRGLDFEGPGVYVHDHSHRNKISHNSIFCNAGKAIQVVNPGNEGILPPVIEITYINTIQGTGTDGNTIHLYVNEKTGNGCNCEAEKYLGETTVSGGKWTFTHNLNLTVDDTRTVTATQTNATNSTSELVCSSTPCDLIIQSQPKDTTICTGGEAQFTVIATGTNVSYQWQENDGNGFVDIQGETNNTLIVATNDISKNGYTYRAIVSINSFTNGLCKDTTDVVTLGVQPATIINSFSSDIILCPGDPLNLSVDASGLNISYTWKFNNTTVGTNSNTFSIPSFAIADAGAYHVEVTGDCGTISSDTIAITYKVAPDNSLSVNGGDICIGSDGAVTVIASQSGVKYQAFIGADAVSDITEGNNGDLLISIDASVLQPGTNIVSIHAYGCGDVVLTNTATIMVLDNPGSITGPTYLCSNATGNLTYSTTQVDGASHYEWYVNGVLELTTNDNSATLDLTSLPANIQVKPITISNLSCGTSPSLTVSSRPGYMGDNLIVSEDTVCAGNTITFYLVNRTAENYSNWEDGLPQGAELINKTDTSATVTFTIAGNYTIEIQPYHSCESSIVPLTVSVVILTPPVAFAGDDQFLDNFTTVTLDGSGSSQGNIYGYQWSANSDAVINNPESIITTAESFNISTDYTLTVYTQNTASCMASDVVTVKVNRGEVFIPNIFSPNDDGLHDYFEIENIHFFPKAVLYIYNQWGEQIYQSQPGYRELWDGTRDGKPVPVSTYYYVLELNEENVSNISGQINIVR